MDTAVSNTHPGRAALAHALRDLEGKAGYGSGSPRRSRSRAIADANEACQAAGLPILASQTVSEWFRLGRAAGDFELMWHLIVVLLGWGGRRASAAEREVWKQRWELARTTEPRPPSPSSPADTRAAAPAAPQPLGMPVSDVDPVSDLEVHPALQQGGSTDDSLPEYVPREHDQRLSHEAEAAQESSRMVVLVGDSSTGKTRALWESVKCLPASWRVWRPADRTALLAGLEQQRSLAHTVLWLNELQRYLLPHNQPDPEGRAAALLTTLLTDPSRGPVLVLGTLWHQPHTTLTRQPDGFEPDPHQQARALLNGRSLTVPDTFSGEALTALKGLARHDARLDEALRCGGQRITQYLAGARELVRLYNDAPPEARAVLDAAADARRLGAGEDLPHAFLYEAAAGYLDPGHWAAQTDAWRASWFARALAYTSQPCRGIPGPLTAKVAAPGQLAVTDVYRLADYLHQHTSRVRWRSPLPAGFWNAAADHLTSPSALAALARAAESRLRLRHAYRLYEAAVSAGEAEAWWKLIWQQVLRGDFARAESLAHQMAGAGHFEGLRGLVRLLNQQQNEQEAERLLQAAADAGDTVSLAGLGLNHMEAGRWDEAERLVRQSGEPWALLQLAEGATDRATAERLLRAAADAGEPEALQTLSKLREVAGDAEGAERLALEAVEAGEAAAAWQLALHREGAGKWEAARKFALRAAASGHPDVAHQLAVARVQAGDVKGASELYEAAADAGHTDSLISLAGLRERAGGVDEAAQLYQAAVDAGHPEVIGWLARLRDQAGHREEAERLCWIAVEASHAQALQPIWAWWDQKDRPQMAEQFALRAAEAGHPEVARQLAYLRDGAGNREASIRLYQAAADAGDTWSMDVLVKLREQASDHEAAEELALRAAKAGDAGPLLGLAHGREDAGHLEQAERLCRAAADLGHAEAAGHYLVQLQERSGRTQEAEQHGLRLADAGYTEPLWQLLQLRKNFDDEEGARRLYQIFTLDAGLARLDYAIPWLYDEETAHRVRCFGLEADGTPTDPDQWQETASRP